MSIEILRNTVGPVLALLLITGCGSTAKVGQFNEFSKAGVQYYQTVTALALESESTLIKKDTNVLLSQRDNFTSKPLRSTVFTKNDTVLSTSLSEIQTFRLLVTRMQRYFSALSKLSSNEFGESLSEDINVLVRKLKESNNALKGVTDNAAPINKPGLIADFVVGELQSAALKKELETNGRFLDDSLRHTATYVNQMIDNLISDKNAEIALSYKQKVSDPFIELKPLPDDWAKERNRLVQLKARSALGESAKQGSEDLRKMYLALANKGTATEEISNFLVGMNELRDFIDVLKAD